MSGGGSPSSSKSEQPQQGSNDPKQREKTPQAPGQKPDEQDKPGGQKPKPNDSQQGDPKSPKESNADPQNLPGNPPPPLDTAKVSAEQANERWGDLPDQVRDLFRTEGGGDMPPEYRDWIDAYYRRLNARR